MGMDQLPLELVQLILARVQLPSLPAAMQVCRAWRSLALELLPTRLAACSLALPVDQEGIWASTATFHFDHFDKSTMRLTFQAQALASADFFYAALVGRPAAKAIALHTGSTEHTIKRRIHFATKHAGIHRFKAKGFAVQYAIQHTKAKGTRSLTPLAFQCSMDFLVRFAHPPKIPFLDSAANFLRRKCRFPVSKSLAYPIKHRRTPGTAMPASR